MHHPHRFRLRPSLLLPVTLAATVLAAWVTLAPAQDGAPPPEGGAEDAPADDAANPEQMTRGSVSAVTVYRGQALITRTIEAPPFNEDGTAEIVVTDLPGNVVPGSLYAESSAAGVEVRSVRYRTRPVQEDVREEVRTIDEKMQDLQREIQRTQRLQAVLQEKDKYLNNLETFSADTSERELKQGVLDAEQLMTLTNFLFEQEEAIALRGVELQEQLAELQQQVQLLQRQRQTVSGGSSRTVREAVVFLGSGAEMRDAVGGGAVSLRYLVNGASWSPSYNLRSPDAAGAGEESLVTLEYYASVQQTSGEDWSNVSMTLSTATPSLIAAPPGLEPLVVALQADEQTEITLRVNAEGYLRTKAKLQEQVDLNQALRNTSAAPDAQRFAEAEQQEAARAGRAQMAALEPDRAAGIADGMAYGGAAPADDNFAANFDNQMNRWSKQIQVLDLVAGRETRDLPGRPGPDRSNAAEGVSVTYELPGRISLPSRSDRQLVQIAQLELPAEYYNRATPVLGEYVYNAAEVHNTGKMVLLAGPTQAFKGGEFVGRGSIPTVAAGEMFTVGFGIDSSLRAGRELVKREEKMQGGNVVTSFTYRITLENFGEEAAAVRVLDRLPHPAREVEGSNLTIDLTDTDPPLSDDADYKQFAREVGILRWDVDVPQNATGGKAKPIEFTFKVEHDRQMTLTLPDSGPTPGDGSKKRDGSFKESERLDDVTF